MALRAGPYLRSVTLAAVRTTHFTGIWDKKKRRTLQNMFDNAENDDYDELCSVSSEELEVMSVSSAKYPGDPIVEAAFRNVRRSAGGPIVEAAFRDVRRSASFTEDRAAKRQCLRKVHSGLPPLITVGM